MTVSSQTLDLATRFGFLRERATTLTAAIVAAHGAQREGGFRGVDVRFFFLLFENWLGRDAVSSGRDLELTQVRRVLERLGEAGWVSATKPEAGDAKRGATYALTEEGLVGLVGALARDDADRPFEESLFLACFGATYADAVAARVRGPGPHIRPEARRRVAAWLSPSRILTAAIRRTRARLAALEERVDAGLAMERLAHRDLQAGYAPADVAAALGRSHPYQLSGMRSFGELIGALPDDLAVAELRTGLGGRARGLFRPLAERARAEVAALEKAEAALAGR